MPAKRDPDPKFIVKGNYLRMNEAAVSLIGAQECILHIIDGGIGVTPIKSEPKSGRHKISDRFIAVGKSKQRYGLRDGQILRYERKTSGMLEFRFLPQSE